MSGHAHSHGTKGVGDRVLLWTVIVNLSLSVFEFTAGAISGSVALMADALHNTNDAVALLVAYIARRIARRGGDDVFTFGYQRAELIGAMIQLTALIVLGLYLVYEAIHRVFEPEPLLGGWIMAAAAVALVVDIATAWLLWAMSKGSLNVRAAFLHNLTDAASSVAVFLGGATIHWLDWTWIDPLLTLGIAGYILVMSVGMLKTTSRILMEGSPRGLSLEEVRKAVIDIEGVASLHHLHVWGLDEHRRAMEAHVVLHDPLREAAEMARLRAEIKRMLSEQFDIAHATLEFETHEHSCGQQDATVCPRA